MSVDGTFLVAHVNVETLARDLGWVTSNEHPYEAFDPLDLDERILDTVFEMYRDTYSVIDSGFNISDKYGLFEYNRWILVEDDSGESLLGFIFLKTTAFGLKIGLTSTDGSDRGRKAIRGFHERVFFVDGVFAEVSDAMERIVTKADAPRVSGEDAQSILVGKSLDVHDDGYHYTRHITGLGNRMKLMVGKPRL